MADYNITIKARVNNTADIKATMERLKESLDSFSSRMKVEEIESVRILSEDDKEIYNMAIKDAAGYMKDCLMKYKYPLGIEFLNSMVEGMKKDCIKF